MHATKLLTCGVAEPEGAYAISGHAKVGACEGAMDGELLGDPVGGLVGAVGVGLGVVGVFVGAAVSVHGAGGFQQKASVPAHSV